MLHQAEGNKYTKSLWRKLRKISTSSLIAVRRRWEDKLWSALRTKGGQKATSRTKSAWLSQLEKSQAPKSSPKMVAWGPMLDWLGRKKSPMLRFLLSCTLHFSWTSAVLVAHCRTALPSAADCRLRRHSVAGLPLIWKVSCEQHRSLLLLEVAFNFVLPATTAHAAGNVVYWPCLWQRFITFVLRSFSGRAIISVIWVNLNLAVVCFKAGGTHFSNT